MYYYNVYFVSFIVVTKGIVTMSVCEFYCRNVLHRQIRFDGDKKIYRSELKILCIENSL